MDQGNEVEKAATWLSEPVKVLVDAPTSADKPLAVTFKGELADLINRYNKGVDSSTPDHVLATYIDGCLGVWEKTIGLRDDWYGLALKTGHDYHE